MGLCTRPPGHPAGIILRETHNTQDKTGPPPTPESGPLLAFPNKRVLDFDFDIIDLGRMHAHSFVQHRNPAALALAARMKFEEKERLSLVREFFLGLAVTPLARQDQELVAGFFSAYHPLSRDEALQLQSELAMVGSEVMKEKVMQLTNPFIELGFHQGIERGVEQGRHEGEVELVLRQLNRRLGSLSASQKRSIRRLNLAKIEALAESLLEFESRSDLVLWLKKHA